MALLRRRAAPSAYGNPQTRSGTVRYDQDGNRMPGEFNQNDQPLGTPAAHGPSALTTFQASQRPATPAPTLPRDYGLAGATAALSPTLAFTPQPLTMRATRPTAVAPAVTPPADAPAARATAPDAFARFALPSNPDDRALLMATHARDVAARAAEPVSIPGGDPAARAWNTARRTGHASTPEPGVPAPVRASANPVDPYVLAAAGTNRDVKTPWGTVSSTTAGEIARRSQMPVPAAATAAPPQGVPVAQPDWIKPAEPAPAAAPTPAKPITIPPPDPASLVDTSPIRAAAADAYSKATAATNTAAPSLGDRIRSAANTGMQALGMAPDFPAAGPGARPGGTGGVTSPIPVGMPMVNRDAGATDFPNPGLTGGRPGGTGTQPITVRAPAPAPPVAKPDAPADGSLAAGMEWMRRKKQQTASAGAFAVQ